MLVVVLVCLVPQLHTPMYFFLCNLAAQDIISVSAFLPKLMAITITGDTSISFPGCITQLFLFITCTDGDFLLLAIMAYDRYVAICIPLRYHLIMNPRFCILLVAMSWIVCAANAMCFSFFISHLSFCRLLDINHIFCETISMLKLSCSDTTHIQTLIAVDAPLIGILPVGLILISYVYIIYTILKMRTSAARPKTFSSCSSHLTVVLLFSGTCLSLYMKPESGNSQEVDKLLSLMYLGFIPMLNPLVYSLRNRKVQSAAKIVFSKYIIKDPYKGSSSGRQ
ncbi:olfactory receptor 1-like [Xenopus tropicalis]|uniref:Olfactory receptor n=1 Tax=Xenopus tropicalis TaxID=8364 RepID=A0A8J0QMG4_XENTR|nr:olfactory receptor 1-like [Xenopus tropicalis]|eukprot:XP_002932815.2 PREDICTED: olfactory receptor 1-like [Xenopus tropicalis]